MVSSIVKRDLQAALVLMFSLLSFGVLGYHYFFDHSWIESLYMTFITISTVGFGEVHPTGDMGKIFTIFLIIAGIFIGTFSLSILTRYVVSTNSIEHLKQRRMKNKIQSLTNHIIVCGYGKNGQQAARRFQLFKKDFVIIDKDIEILKRESNILYVNANASDDQALKDAGVTKAKYLIASLPNDADNLFVVLSARQLNKDLIITSRVLNESSGSKLYLAGANHVVMPDKIAGTHMALLMLHPELTVFLEKITGSIENQVNVRELSTSDMSDEFVGITIVDLNMRQKTGCNVIGYKPFSGDYIINPDGNMRIEKGSKLVVLGREEQIKAVNKMFKPKKL